MMSMNMKPLFSLLAAVSICVAGPALAQNSAGGKSSDSGDKTKKTTQNGTDKSKQAKSGGTPMSGKTENVDVNMTDRNIDMPNTLTAGNKKFVIKDTGSSVHRFSIEGGTLKNVVADVSAGRTATIGVDMAPGTYKVGCVLKEHQGKEPHVTLTVK